MSEHRIIPIAKADEALDPMVSACQAKEPFALMVLGDSMVPEFMEGEVIVIDPEGVARDGSYILAFHKDEYIFRQLRIVDEQWYIAPLNPAYPTEVIADKEAVRGVIVQKKTPGKRGSHRFY